MRNPNSLLSALANIDNWEAFDDVFDGALDPYEVAMFEDELNEEFGAVMPQDTYLQVDCRNGCGLFELKEVNVTDLKLSSGYATFRCPMCNELQTRTFILVD